MGKYSDTEWYQAELKKYIEKYGDVPPPWVFSPNSHPYSISWRMGAGETYIIVFSEWYGDGYKSEHERISYFKKYPPPPRWLGWMAEAIWNLDPWDECELHYTPYFNKLKQSGFEGIDDYEKDLRDEKWI
jgi:hypothetical protein